MCSLPDEMPSWCGRLRRTCRRRQTEMRTASVFLTTAGCVVFYVLAPNSLMPWAAYLILVAIFAVMVALGVFKRAEKTIRLAFSRRTSNEITNTEDYVSDDEDQRRKGDQSRMMILV
jgi:Ca2+/Na+ antiporter